MYGSVIGEDGRYDAFETVLEILRVKRLYPRLSPRKYAEKDDDFNKFMRCKSGGGAYQSRVGGRGSVIVANHVGGSY